MHPSNWGRVAALFVAALAAVAVACSSSGPIPPDRASATVVPASRSASGSTGIPEVLNFTAPALGGGAVNGNDYVGKDVAIWFWAPW